jgi:Uncharacterized conserved protein related to C-terminal domain of eukaryotic chaperone, SACSIN
MTGDTPDLISYRMLRSHETLQEARMMINSGFCIGAVNRTYYACYYAISALLLKNDISAQTHKGVRQKFGHHFVVTGLVSKEMGRYFSDLFDRRHAGDYDDFITYDKTTCEILLSKAVEFIDIIETLLNQ